MELGAVGIGAVQDKGATGKARVFAELQSFIVGVRARWIKKQDAKRVPWPAVVAEKALEAGLLDACLLVNGSNLPRGRLSRSLAQGRVVRLRPAQNRVYERRSSRPEVERGDGPTDIGLQQCLVFGRGEEQFAGAIRVVIEQL